MMSTAKILVLTSLYVSMCTVSNFCLVEGTVSNHTGMGRFRADTSPVKRFPCRTFIKPPGDVTVHRLTPMDVGVVAALGDSITAGLGITAKDTLGFREDRGMSFSIGGDCNIDQLISLPNILKIYNPNLKGYSRGYGYYLTKDSHLNVAQIGAVSELLPLQAFDLIRRMKFGTEDIDYENDWKVITVFIGANDICLYCTSKTMFGASSFVSNIRRALDILHREVPKAFVNVIGINNLLDFQNLGHIRLCNVSHRVSCPCVGNALTPEKQDVINNITRQYQQGLRNLINSGRYDTTEDFTVVLQPFLTGTTFSTLKQREIPTLSLLSHDCFHLSKIGHEFLATSLWINMIQPVGHKHPYLTVNMRCPTWHHPYFATRKNGYPLTFNNEVTTPTLNN